MMQPGVPPSSTASNRPGGLSNWNVSTQRPRSVLPVVGSTNSRFSLSGMLQPNLAAQSAPLNGATNTSASSAAEFVSLVGRRSVTSRGVAIHRTLRDTHRTHRAIATAEGGQAPISQTERYTNRGTTQQGNRTHNQSDETFSVAMKLSAAEAQSAQYRDRIASLERQLHVALAANKQQQQQHSHSARSNTATPHASLLPVIDHFPMPPMPQSAASTIGHPSRPFTSFTSAEEKTPTHHAQSQSHTAPHIFPRSRTALTAASEPNASTAAELAGLHQLLDEYETLFDQQSRSMAALKKENDRLKLHLHLSNSLLGFVESIESPGRSPSPDSPPAAAGSGDDIDGKGELNHPTLPTGTTKMLRQNLHSLASAPAWLTQLIDAQSSDPPNLHHHQHHPYPHSGTSPMSTQSRIFCRGEAFKYILSTLTPHLNVRDRSITVLFDEFIREHAWLSASFAYQSTILNALVDHLRKRELGIDSAEDRAAGLEFFKRKEAAEQAAQAQANAQANAQRLVLWRDQNNTPASPQLSGLVAGSAGTVTRTTPRTLSASPSPPPPRNAPVQVDGGGSHCIGLGLTWLVDDHSSSRPFQDVPNLRATQDSLHGHLMRFVLGAGMDVPIEAAKEEHDFTRAQLAVRGFSHTPGGIANVDTSQQAPPVTASANPPPTAVDGRSRSDNSTSDDESPTELTSASRSARGYFRERTGEKNTLPPSVRKWSTVEQLDYVGTPEYSSDSSSRKPRARPAKVDPPHKRERGTSRSYTQTALGALSEPAPEELNNEEQLQIAHPFTDAHPQSGTVEYLKSKAKEAQDAASSSAVIVSSHLPSPPPLFPPAPLSLSSLSAASPNPGMSMSPPPATANFAFANAMNIHTTNNTNTTPAPTTHTTTLAMTTPNPNPDASTVSLQSEHVPLSSLKLLYDLLKFISFKLHHTQQLKHVVHVVRRMVGSDRVTLWFVDHFRHHIWSTIGTAVTNEIRVKLGVGIAGGVAASGKAVTMTNATYDQRFLKKVESGTDYITRAVMCIPLKTPRNQTFAVLQIMNKERVIGGNGPNNSGGYFTRTDELLAHLTCQHLAQNLWASEMYQIALRERLKTQAVFEHADQLLSCIDVKEMLTSLVTRIRMLMDADYAVLFALSSNLDEPAAERDTASGGGGGGGIGSDTSMRVGEDDDRPNTAAGKKSKRVRSNAPSWGDDAAEPLKEELITITESCTPQIAIIIPQGYAGDRRGDGFKFNTIRVPLSSGGIATQVIKSGKVVNVFDTRLDPRFNQLVDEYISDTIGGGGKAHCTRAFVAIPIMGHGTEPEGVLVLGKLIPKAFQEWEVGEVADLQNVIWMGIRRYRQDRIANLRMHDRISSINRMVSHLDLESGGSGVILTAGDDESVVAAIARGAVVVTAEGPLNGTAANANTNIGKMKDPVSGEILPSIEEYQRSRLLFPNAPELGSTLADAFFKNELTKSAAHPYGTLLHQGVDGGTIDLPVGGFSSTLTLPTNPPAAVSEIDQDQLEAEMRDPRAPPLPGAEKKKVRPAKPMETLTMQREADAHTLNAEDDLDDELESGLTSPAAKKRSIGAPLAPPPARSGSPLKPIDYTRATYTAPINTRPASFLPQGSVSSDSTQSPPVPITSYKPVTTSLHSASDAHVAEQIDHFHHSTIHVVTPHSDVPSLGVAFNDSAGAYLPIDSMVHVQPPKTVSKIALRDMTDIPQVDAIKSVTYRAQPEH